MRTIRWCVGVALLGLLISQAQADHFTALSEISAHYLRERAVIAPIVPPLLPSTLNTLRAMLLNEDFSFQELDGWYFGWSDGPHSAGGELAGFTGLVLVAYEDLATASIKLCTRDGKVLALFPSEPFPNLSALKGDACDRALLAELNKRSIVFAFSFAQPEATATPFGSAPLGGGYAMMSMGGQYEMEAVDLDVTNDGMAVTFAWPEGSFTNRLDIYAYDGETYAGISEIASLITGTNWNGPRFFGLRSKIPGAADGK